MGLFDKIKDATGVGLNAQQQYLRAYEKGVLLQPPDYESAAKQFYAASEKFTKDGNQTMAKHARANSALYHLVVTRDRTAIGEVIRELESVPEIERIGSQKEMIPTAPIIIELTALQHEFSAESIEDSAGKVQAYRQASDTFMKLGMAPIPFAEKLQFHGPADKAMLHAFYCTALADYHDALCVLMESPTQAHDRLQKAAVEFRQATVTDRADSTESFIKQVQAERHCWMCGRKMQGRDIFYRYYPASTQKYHNHVIQDLKQDTGMIDSPGNVTLCTVCGSAVEKQADLYATKRMNELKEWVTPILQNHSDLLEEHARRLKSLENVSHRH